MNNFRRDGVYLKMYDAVKDGYYTKEDGKLKKHKYGLLDKLYDLHRYGKTMSVSYGYIYFCESINNELELYMGTMGGELSEILKTWEMKIWYGGTHFCFDNEHTVKYLDKKNRECYLTIFNEGRFMVQNYFDFNTEEPKSNEYSFYLFPEPLFKVNSSNS